MQKILLNKIAKSIKEEEQKKNIAGKIPHKFFKKNFNLKLF
jgi:hypothetical protein